MKIQNYCGAFNNKKTFCFYKRSLSSETIFVKPDYGVSQNTLDDNLSPPIAVAAAL